MSPGLDTSTPHNILQPYLCVHMHAAGGPSVQLLAQIHDELLFEVPEAHVGATAAAVRGIMEGAGISSWCVRTTAVQ